MENENQPELRKARLKTGETLWVKLEGDFARIDNIPVSTDDYAYGDLVLLTIAADGMCEIAERLQWGGYTTAMLKASNHDGPVREFFRAPEKITVTERVDDDHIIVTARSRDWMPLLKKAVNFSARKTKRA